ncbi:hypothetical protein K438DRAFT_1783258 [Mycena galopus ATCC 62051]|nr:hypothetical protein K438DRAFT_1783258 [Mycena galopus ATCC 62051]
MLRKDAVVGDLQEQVSEAHSTNSDPLAHNIQLNIHQCHTQFSSFTAISEGTQKTLQVRLKMASEISDAEYSSLSSLIVQVDTPKVDWWAWAGSRGVSGTVRIDVTFKTLFVWFELIVQVDSSRLELTPELIFPARIPGTKSTWKSTRVAVSTRLDSTQVGGGLDFKMT